MERKLFLRFLLVGVILLIIYKINNPTCGIENFTSTLHPIHPNGSYKDKCKQVFYDGVKISALCSNLSGIYVNTRYCTHECPCVDRAATQELKCGCSTNKFDVDDNGQLICEK
jgi:hypothetical protein